MILLLLACTPEPAGDPALTLVTPEDGDIVCGTPLHIEVALENFRLVNESTTAENAASDEGHVHAWLNGQEVAQAVDEAFDVQDIADAEYQLRVDLARADHQALDPYVGETIYITVDSTTCD